MASPEIQEICNGQQRRGYIMTIPHFFSPKIDALQMFLTVSYYMHSIRLGGPKQKARSSKDSWRKDIIFTWILLTTDSTFQLQVSWIRHKDTHLLSSGSYTYTSDHRFKAIHKHYSEDYLLQIMPTTPRDEGKYECQISTTPPTGHILTLTIAGEFPIWFHSLNYPSPVYHI